jgi:hypothetical protein
MKMKSLIVASMLALAGVAQAEIINLGGENCGIIKQCNAVPNDSADATQIDILGAPQYGFFYVTLTQTDPVTGLTSATSYYFGQPSGLGVTGAVGQSFYFVNFGLPGMTRVFTGQTITLTNAFTTYRTCTHSGRGQTCNTHYVLSAGGTVTR